jgi:hypothetical protein
MNKEEFEKIANDILEQLKKEFRSKGKVATGKTIKSLRAEASEVGFKIFGGDWIEFVEYGRGPIQNKKKKTNFLENLQAWARAVGFPESKVRFLKYYINKYGTKLYRDGKNAEVLTSVFNQDLIQKLNREIYLAQIKQYSSEIKRLF